MSLRNEVGLSVFSVSSVAFSCFALTGCGSGVKNPQNDPQKIERAEHIQEGRKERLVGLLPGRWTGEPVAPPEGVWFEKAKFDIELSDRGDFTAIVSTFNKRPYELRFEGEY